MQTCPDCGLINPDEAQRCDCGFELAANPRLQPGEEPRNRDISAPIAIATLHGLITALGVATVAQEGSLVPLTLVRAVILAIVLLLPPGWLVLFLRFAERRPWREAAKQALFVAAITLLLAGGVFKKLAS